MSVLRGGRGVAITWHGPGPDTHREAIAAQPVLPGPPLVAYRRLFRSTAKGIQRASAVQGGSSSAFTYQPTTYLSIIDGIAGHGHATGAGWRPATGGDSRWYYIVNRGASLSIGSAVETDTYECGIAAACEDNVSNKVIINLTSGLFDLTSLTELNLRGDNVTMIGFTCRYGTGYGSALKLRSPIIIRGSNVFISGWRIFVDTGGAIPPYLDGTERDGTSVFGATSNIVLDRMEVYGAIDETFDFTNATDGISVNRSAICSPNSNSGIHDVGHNYGISTGYNASAIKRFSQQQVAYFHAAGRFPLGLCTRVFSGDSMIYNISDGAGNNSQVFQFDRHPSDTGTDAHKAICANMLFLNGPQGYANNWAITAANQIVGTGIYGSGNRARGFNNVSNSDPVSFFGTESGHDARQWRVTTIPSDTAPGGVGNNLEYLTAFSDDATRVTALQTAVGQHPKYPADSKLTTLFTQAQNWIAQNGQGYGAVGTAPSDPSLTEYIIDRNSSSDRSNYWGGIEIPGPATRDTLMAGAGSRTYGEDAVRRIGNLSIGL